MTPKKVREIVIEVEKVQLIRKRARTEQRHCLCCRTVSDAVSHVEAAELFETEPGRLFAFIQQNNCHYDVGYSGKIYLCVPSLLAHFKTISLAAGQDPKLLGESK